MFGGSETSVALLTSPPGLEGDSVIDNADIAHIPNQGNAARGALERAEAARGKAMTPMGILTGEWTAFHDHMPGKAPTLRVSGTCTFDNSGWTVELTDSSKGTGSVKMLDLVATSPSGISNPIVTDVPAHFEEETDTEYTDVHVIVQGSDESKIIHVECLEVEGT